MIDSILENFSFFKKLLLNLKSELGYYTYKSIRSFYLRKHNEYNHWIRENEKNHQTINKIKKYLPINNLQTFVHLWKIFKKNISTKQIYKKHST